ncbi:MULTISPECIES: glycine betaine ABC transporter substrate-binding protein [unclassified Arthrobacter]|uniref:glycine betaine ABC transporter substrate-binding protein n=1 Tax=unclassified Arthrobacter TaxID=235627 RepID=UPI001E4DE311|nr:MULTISPECIES: glycine betaine ABC transporter substrate-binding protein [unclassified Arthrobacter]MCC9144596.1 glycine betaine ABC transporter substrate-binding protein [Arthrobacter sp. zg-Y919]MDK1275822.1 glycine betaine ABC transporter substrate-binding protein [Arthrobacter sp. zg.Y919]WIB02815.1 glycine betaine ABC transporter substrate-binding protein [Arthrobacter sp. zg-Y919]
MNKPSTTRVRLAAVGAAAVGLLLSGCGLQPAASYVPEADPGSIQPVEGLPDDAKLTVTSKNFTEQLILGKIAVLATKVAGFEVTDLTNVPGSQPARELLLSGQAGMTWEYTGTGWIAYLGQSAGIPDKQEQWQAVHDADLANGVTWGDPAPLNNTYAMAIRTEAAQELGVQSISDIARLPVEDRTFCLEAEFNSRPDGMNPLLEKYGMPRGAPDGVPDANVGIYDTGAVYSATDAGECNFGEVFATDGRIDSLGLTVLEDDLAYFPAYNAAPVFNTEALEEYPVLVDIFAQVSPLLTDEELRKMNLAVDVNGQEPADVAFDWMVEKGLITAPE